MKNNNFFFDLIVSRTNEKKRVKKIKICAGEVGWATAHFFVLGHDTTNCIVTQGSWARAKGARYGRASAGARSRTL